MHCHRAYMVPYGVLKGVEFITSLIAWTIWVYLLNGHQGDSGYNFYLSMNVIAWLFAMCWFLSNIFGWHNRISCSSKHIWFGVIHLILGLIVLAAGGTTTNRARPLFGIGGPYVARVEACLAFGVITGLVLIVDGIVHLAVGKKIYGGSYENL